MKNFTLKGFIALFFLLTVQIHATNTNFSVSTDKTDSKVVTNNHNELKLNFKFGEVNYFDVKTTKGIFTKLIMPGAYTTERIGEPALPAQKKLISIPFGATVNVKVNSFDVSTIDLNEKGIANPLMPLQYSLPKNIDVSDVPFEYKEAAYSSKSFNQSEMATVEVLGTMRGVRIARVNVEPIRYNPSTNQIEVYNNIEVSITYENADWDLTERTYKSTYNPFYQVAYNALLNVNDSYDDHPDLLTFPVKMIIISDPMFADALQPFIEWKTKTGYELTVAYTDEIGSSTSEIQTWLHNEYETGLAEGNAPDFVVFVGDIDQIPASATGSESGRKTDLYYCSVDGDIFPEMYYGRLSAQNVGQLTAQLDKILYYQKYEFETPEFLNDVTLIAGSDGTWNPRVGQPTILYGTENYFNAEHGYNNIYVYLDSYAGCYDDERFQTSFINYTAHCSETSWANPALSIGDVNAMNNPNEYPVAIGNCCMSADFGYSECIGEAFMRRENGGAVGYIGSSPSSYWFEDFYWGVGAFPIQGTNDGYVPTYEETTMGAYDGAWGDSYYCLDALVFVGNLAVTEVHAQGWPAHSSPTYYWQAYNTLGDPSLMPYHTEGSVNDVDHMAILPIGLNQYEVTAEPGSYVAISKDGVIHGTGVADENGVALVELTPVLSAGDVDIVVTKSQYIPYVTTVPAAALEGPFLTITDYTFPNGTSNADYGTTADLDIVLKNLGTEASDDVTVSVLGDDEYCTLTSAATIDAGTIDADEELAIEDAFTFEFANDAPDQYSAKFDVEINGTSKETWETNLSFTVMAPVPGFGNYSIDDSDGNNNGRIDPGETFDLTMEVKNMGHAISPEGTVEVTSSNSYLTVNTASVDVAAIDAEGTQEVIFNMTASDDTPVGTLVGIYFDYTAGGYNAEIQVNEIVGLILEDFETGDFSSFDWEFNSSPWVIVEDVVYEGNNAAKSAPISSNGNSSMELTYNVIAEGNLSFFYKVSSESGYDYLRFYINGTEQDSWSGEVDWTEATYTLSEGENILKWEYSKDGSVDNGQDCGWVDFIIFPASASGGLNASFTVDTDDICDGGTVNYTSTSTEATSWNWVFEGGDPATSTEENPTVTYATAGEYDVTFTVSDGTNEVTSTLLNYITVHNCTGIETVENASVKLYPNPNNGEFILDIQGMENANITIMNSVGSIVYQERHINTNNSMKHMDLSQQAEGIYMIIVENNETRIIEKIIIK